MLRKNERETDSRRAFFDEGSVIVSRFADIVSGAPIEPRKTSIFR
jgi:hypothetical protein